MKSSFWKVFLLGVGVASMSVSCDKDDNGEGGNSRLQFRLTDNPGDYQQVNVDIQAIEVTRPGGPVTVSVNQGIYNLLDYTGGADTLIADQDFPSGRINQIRLILGNDNSVMIDSVIYDLQTPSAQQSGLKLNLQKDLQAGLTYAFTLDFDAAKSVVETGAGTYILKPVIRIITDEVDGAIRGEVAPDSVSAAVMAILGSDTMSTFTDPAGHFFIGGLENGSYDVIVSPQGALSPQTFSGITVTQGQVTDMGVVQF